MRKASVAVLSLIVLAAMFMIPASGEMSEAATGATLEGYIWDESGEKFSETGTVNISVYRLTDALHPEKLTSYTLIGKCTSLNVTESVAKYTVSDIDTTSDIPSKDVYIWFDIENYSVNIIQTKYFDDAGTVSLIDSTEKRTMKMYNLVDDFGDAGKITGTNTYTIGTNTQNGAGLTVKTAEGTLTGKVLNEDGSKGIDGASVAIIDSSKEVLEEVFTSSDGSYSLKYRTGTYSVVISSDDYSSKTLNTVRIYNETTYLPSMNAQDDVKLNKIPVTGNISIVGYISNASGTDFSKATNIDIILYFKKADGVTYELIAQTKTIEKNADGEYYTFTLKNDKIDERKSSSCYLYINIDGYSVNMVQTEYLNSPGEICIIDGDERICYQFKSTFGTAGYIKQDHEYQIGDKTNAGIQMKSAKGTVTGKVTTNTSNPTSLNGAKVNIINTKTGATVASGVTSNNGNYSIKCDTGNYNITVEMTGYKSYKGQLTVYDDTVYNPEKNIQPDIRLEEDVDLFGTDLPHALMIVGVALAAILIVVVIFHRLRIFGKGEVIYDDVEEEKK